MLKVRGCKKCHGALLLDKDEFGWYEQCIQCGYTRDIPLDISLHMPLRTDPVPVPVINDTRELVERWKHDRLPSFQPIRDYNDSGEDATY